MSLYVRWRVNQGGMHEVTAEVADGTNWSRAELSELYNLLIAMEGSEV